MNKHHAVTLARAGVTAGRLREILNAAQFDGDEPCVVNSNFTKRCVWSMFHGGMTNLADNTIVDYYISLNILREFAEEKTK